MRRKSIIAIVGPNSSGKSELAVNIAKKFNGEIISVDSRQIYKNLNIGTGKIPGRWKGDTFIYKGIPHYGIDFVSPQKQFSAAEFKNYARVIIANILSRNKTPVLAGGTGFWMDALAYDQEFPPVPPNLKLRKALSGKSPEKLAKILKKLDPERLKTVELKNPRRLIRAIEIAKVLGRVPRIKNHFPYRALWIGLDPSREELKKKIYRRLLARIKAGMIREGKKLRQSDLSWKRFYELGLEYKFLADHLRGRTTKTEMIQRLFRAICQYARRQMVWFKSNKKIHWIKDRSEAEKLVRQFLFGN